MAIFKQRLFWLGIVIVLAVIAVFGLAMMGSVLGAKPRNLPVALVVLDKGVEVPGGGKLAVGEMVKQKLLDIKELPVRWQSVGTVNEAMEGMDRQEYYGALILQEDLSAGVASLQSPAPHPGTVRIVINDGMNSQAASAVRQILHQVMDGAGKELTKQILGQIGQKTKVLPLDTAQALLAPFKVEEQAVHPVGANHAGGSAPNLLTQIMWISSMIGSVFLFLSAKKALSKGDRRWQVILWQTAAGILLAAAASGLLIWMSSSWYGMELQDLTGIWLILWLAGSVFFLLQSSLFNWLGLPAIGVLVLLLFFSIPVINMAPELLPQATQDWLYSWTPLRFAAAGVRDVLYFGSIRDFNFQVLWYLFAAFLVVLAASAFKPGVRQATQVSLD